MCALNIFSNSVLNTELPTAPLSVKIAFVDAISGRLLESVREATLKLPEGACFVYQPPQEQAETTVLGVVVPMSQDSRIPSSELLPIASAMVMNGFAANARVAYIVPLVPKANLLVPGR